MKEELPALRRERARGLDQPVDAVPRVHRALARVGGVEIDEDFGREPLPVDVARAPVDPVEAVEARSVPGIAAQATRQIVGRLVDHFGNAGRHGEVREIDFDGDLRSSQRQLSGELGDLRLQIADAEFERRHPRVLRRVGTENNRRGRLVVVGDLAHADVVADLVRGLQRFFEAAKTHAIEAERIGRLVEPRTLFGRDDAVFDDLGKDLFVVGFELA
jgi:hypothetical protein